MRANIRQYEAGEWLVVEVNTSPMGARVGSKMMERYPDFDVRDWIRSLPPVLFEGNSTKFTDNPEAWLKQMARMNYTRMTVELLQD